MTFMTWITTLLIFGLTFILQKPFAYILKGVLLKNLERVSFFREQISKRIQAPFRLFSAALLWGGLAWLLPSLWQVLGMEQAAGLDFLISALFVAVKVALGAGLVWAGYNLVEVLVDSLVRRMGKAGVGKSPSSDFRTHFVPFITHFSKILVVIFGGLILLQNLGVNVSSMLAGLGLGGVAVALAAKDSASNVLSYINIMLDRPFSVGDWVSFEGGTEGTVVEVGLRSCKIKTFYDSIITIPNNTLATTNIDNLGKRTARRTRVFLGVQYDTPPEKLENFIEGIKQIILKNPATKKDYFQVYFTEFGASDLKIITNFFLIVKDWETELKERQSIFMEILKLAGSTGVQFAFPTRTLHLSSVPDSFSRFEGPTK